MPNFMVVVPESKHVRIHYGYGTAERVGWMLSLGGACVLVAPAARLAMAWRRSWRRGHLPTAAQTDPMCEGDAPE